MMKLNKKQLWAFLTMTLLVSSILVIMVTMINVTSASPDTYIYVDPSEVWSVASGGWFVVNISVSDAPSTYAWALSLSWDNSVLNLTKIYDPYEDRLVSVLEGDFLCRRYFVPGPNIWVKNFSTTLLSDPLDEANDAGEIEISCTLQGNVTWASGSGWLCTLNFTVGATGSSVLDLHETRLHDHYEEGTLTPTYYLNQDGFFANVAIHDVAVTSVTKNATSVQPGQTVNITVIVKNQGNYSNEAVNVAVYADVVVYNMSADSWPDEILVGDEITIDTYSIPDLDEDDTNTTTNIIWNTTGLAAETYTISANATLNPTADDDPRDNMRIDGTVKFIVDHDLKVTDVTILTPQVLKGELANMTVNVENQGSNQESFTLYVNATGSATYNFNTTSDTLSAGANSTYNISWNTTEDFAGLYTISANLSPISGEREVDEADNLLVDGTVRVMIHDLSVSAHVCTPAVYEDYQLANMTVTVENQGTEAESYTLYIKANKTKPINYTITTIIDSVAAGASDTHNVSWNTDGVTWGWYNISFYVVPHVDEVDTADNTVQDVWVHVLIPGDIDMDGDVDPYDLGYFADHYMQSE